MSPWCFPPMHMRLFRRCVARRFRVGPPSQCCPAGSEMGTIREVDLLPYRQDAGRMGTTEDWG